jgi:hypothetical protein
MKPNGKAAARPFLSRMIQTPPDSPTHEDSQQFVTRGQLKELLKNVLRTKISSDSFNSPEVAKPEDSKGKEEVNEVKPRATKLEFKKINEVYAPNFQPPVSILSSLHLDGTKKTRNIRL